MVTTLVAVCVVLLVGLLVCAIELWSFPRRRRRVVINLRGDEHVIEGVLWTRRGAWLLVKDARLLRPNGDVVPADGEVLIDRAQVAFIQVL